MVGSVLKISYLSVRRVLFVCSAALTMGLLLSPTATYAQSAAQSTVQEIAARDIVFDAESGLLSVDVGAVPVADVLRSIAEQASAKLTIHGNLGTTVAQRFKGIPLERGIRRLVAGEMSFGMVIEYEPASSNSGARVPVTIVVYASVGSSIADAPPSRSAGDGDIAAAIPQFPGQPVYDRNAHLERIVEVRDLARSGGRAAAERLASILSESDDPTVRRNAAVALGKFGDNAAARAALIDALSDDYRLSQMAAFKSLAKVGGDGATTAFVRVLSEADDPLSRRAAALALGEVPDQVARKALERATSDAHPTVVEAAEHALAQWQQQFGQ